MSDSNPELRVVAVAACAGHSFSKPLRDSICLVEGYGVEGDAHAGPCVYIMDKEMQELGTAAVHLLTIATSYMRAHNE